VGIDYPPPDADVTFTYDALGNRQEMVDGVGTTTWRYDDLNRPIAVTDPFSGTVGYGYDAAGNRVQLTYPDDKRVGYTYDPANRLEQVTDWDTQVTAYTWDDDGNLLNDGGSAYTYNHANRLTSVDEGGNTHGYAYNGLGDRLQQTVNGTPTSYTLDVEAGLTEVLADGSNAYLYGMGRIGNEQPEGWQYHLDDALDSVRQLTHTDPKVILAQYHPSPCRMAK
jgi:YD repeat-containing protein